MVHMYISLDNRDDYDDNGYDDDDDGYDDDYELMIVFMMMTMVSFDWMFWERSARR